MTEPRSEGITLRRKWLAISGATLVATVSYWAIVIAFASTTTDAATRFSAGSFGLGVALIPFAFLVLAFASNNRRAPGSVLAAMGLSIVVGAPVLAISNPILGLVAGLAAGGVVALRADEPHRRSVRAVGALIGVLAVAILTLFVPPVGIALAPGFPFTSIGVADLWAEARA